MRKLNTSGFTFTEVAIATTLLAVAILGAVSTFITLSRLHQKSLVIQDLQQQARFMVESIERDISNGSGVYTREKSNGPDDGNPANDMLVIESGLVNEQEVRYYFSDDGKQVFKQLCSQVTASVAFCDGQEAAMLSNDIEVVRGSIQYVSSTVSTTGAGFVELSFALQKNGDLAPDDPYFKHFEISTIVSLRG